ncbi:MAG: DNA polymerase IV [Actinomycetota bacterium]|nr:DNA polymerase IV [Actinomycetota bacterium]
MIAHVDMDAFYVAVELLRHPELRGKPIVVAYDGPRGVVTTASYEARRYGVHSALPMVTAHRRCPALTVLPVDMQLYRRGSVRVMETLAEFSDTIEVVGMDEAYVDLSASPVPQSRAREIKRRVREETRLVCSIGLAPNKLMAKIASDLDKPDGFCVLDEGNWLAAVGEKPVSLLPGVGPRTEARLERIGIGTVAELGAADPALLEHAFGPKHGRGLRERANGIGSSTLTTERRRKSESRETTFRADVSDRAQLVETAERLAGSVCKSLHGEGNRGRTVTLKVRLRPFRTYTRSRTLDSPTRDAEIVTRVALELLERFDPTDPVRLIGVGVAGIVPDEDADANGPAAPTPASEGDATGPLMLDLDVGANGAAADSA